MAMETIPTGSNGDDNQDDSEFGESFDQKKARVLGETQAQIDSILRHVEPLSKINTTVQASFHSDPNPFEFVSLPDLFSTDSTAEAQSLFKEALSIVQEKGFRFVPSLLTGAEHSRIGSSGYGKFEKEDPDMPVPLLEPRLAAAGKIEPPDATPMGFDEVDRARRLAGMTYLDPATQRVTTQKDVAAAADSYHFLSSERKEAIQKREIEILGRVTDLANHSLAQYQGIRGLRDDVQRYMEGELTSPQMRTRYESAANIMSKETHDRTHFDGLKAILREAKMISFETGKRDNILTPQEIKLRVTGEVLPQYEALPYRPLAVQNGANVQEIAGLRQGEATMVVTNKGIMEFEMPWGFQLQELDPNGDTLQSPTILSRDSLESIEESLKTDERFKNQVSVPFARLNDWYYKKSE